MHGGKRIWKNRKKIRVEEALNKKAEEMREIKFYDVTLELGYKHIKTEDVKTIATRF